MTDEVDSSDDEENDRLLGMVCENQRFLLVEICSFSGKVEGFKMDENSKWMISTLMIMFFFGLEILLGHARMCVGNFCERYNGGSIAMLEYRWVEIRVQL